MGGSSKKQTVGYKYFLGEHMALCHGPVDKLVRVRIDKRDVWRGGTTGGRITVNKPNLFGGESREGGIAGDIDIEMGGPTQGQNDYLLARLGNPLPSFRGVVCAILRQVYLGMNPYLKPWDFRFQRVHTRQDGIAQWYDAKAGIPRFSLSFAYTDVWKYQVVSAADSGQFGVPAEYISPNYDDSGWPEGPGGFGSNNDGGGHGVGTYIPAGECGKSIWIRKTITFSNSELSQIGDFNIDIYHDDGRKLWWNGEEITLTQTQDYYHSTAIIQWEKIKSSNVIVLQIIDCVPGGSSSNIYAGIDMNNQAGSQEDMNPAHIIRECLTDPDWGMGYPDTDIDDTAFQAAADALYGEGMGMSLLWDRSIALEDFIGEVLRHIDAVLYVDRSSGKFVLELIRGDYTASNLLLLDENNISRIERFKRPTLGELVNSITVTYWNAETGEDASINATDLALMQLQGSMIAESVQYPGFTNSTIAGRVLARDLRARSTPLATCVVYANRDAADLHVGSPFRLTWPDLDVSDLVMRVTKIDYGDQGNPLIRIECVEDVFGLPESVTTEQGSLWTDAVADPAECPYRAVLEAPYYELVQRLGEDAINTELGTYPERGYLVAAGTRPSDDAIHAILMTDAGAGYTEAAPPMAFCPVAVLDADIGRTDTVLAIASGVDLDLVYTGTHMQIGSELCRVDAVSDTSLTVGRGVLDTVPAAHSAGETLLFWDDFPATDGTAYADAESVSAKLLPVTGSGTLAQAAAPVDTVVFGRRAIRPYPPGNVTINGTPYAQIIAGTASLSLTWAHRDRLQQTAGSLIDTTAGDIGPETGTTYNIRIYNEYLTTLLRTASGISGTSYIYSISDELADIGTISPPYQDVIIAAAPTAYWKLDEASGTIMASAIGGYDGAYYNSPSLNQPPLIAVGRSVAFDGSTQYATVPDNAVLRPGTAEYAIEMWAKFTGVTYGMAFGKFIASSPYTGPTVFFNFANDVETPGRIEFRDKRQSGFWVDSASTALNDGVARHYVFQRRQVSAGVWKLQIYIDGVLDAEITLPIVEDLNTTNDIYVCSRPTQLINGTFDEVAYYVGKSLSAAEVASHYDARNGITGGRINGRLRFELESERDGYASWQQHNITVLREGYGFNYGELYGGAP